MAAASVEGRRRAPGAARGQFQVHAVVRSEMRADDARRIPAVRPAPDGIAQDRPRFPFHGAVVVRHALHRLARAACAATAMHSRRRAGLAAAGCAMLVRLPTR